MMTPLPYSLGPLGRGRGGGAAPVAGYALWYDASALTGLSDGSLVSSFTDQSGNGRHATASGGLRPTYKTAIQNGLPVVRFAGAQALTVPAVDLSATTGVTLFWVGNASGSGTVVLYEYSDDFNSYTDAFALFRSGTGTSADASLRGNVGYNQVDTSTNPITLSTTTRLLAAVYDKSQTTNEANIWVDGVAGLRHYNTNNNTNAFGNRSSYLGARGAAAFFVTGDLAEVLLYPTALTTTQRQTVESYLKAKWATP